jgi:hypothetical protein
MDDKATDNEGNGDYDGSFDPIAIIGMSCRFSGMADTPDAFWQMLSKGMTSWSRDARNRFKLESFWHPKNDLAGSIGFTQSVKQCNYILCSIVQCQWAPPTSTRPCRLRQRLLQH